MNVEQVGRIIKHAFTEPKFVAIMDWHREYGTSVQLMAQVPREEAVGYVATGKWANPDREITLVMHEMPDWDWWEPRYDQPWRRQAARERERREML